MPNNLEENGLLLRQIGVPVLLQTGLVYLKPSK